MFRTVILATSLVLLAGNNSIWAGVNPALDPAHPLIGTLECDPARIAATNDAGARGVVVGIGWGSAEPGDGQFNTAYLREIGAKIDAFRAGGKLVVIDFGVQYPPGWIFRLPSSHFQNQYQQTFDVAPGDGNCGVNLVFSQEMRDKFEAYVSEVFHELGNDFYAVRLGGGRYGELGYPINVNGGHANCYWAFDPIAQGQQPGLATGVKPDPVTGWTPGAPSPNHGSARQFLDWYMESMKNYHDWQITTLRKYFSGPLFMMYPSTGGIRPASWKRPSRTTATAQPRRKNGRDRARLRYGAICRGHHRSASRGL